MFLIVWFAILSLIAFGQTTPAPAPCLAKPAAERPYSKDRLLPVIRDQTAGRAEFLIRTCGVSVRWSDGLLAELKSANASDKVIQAVRDVTGGSKPKVVVPVIVGPKPGDIRTNSKEGVTYAFIPAGTFQMGCDDSQGCEKDELPVHKVRITKGFWMGQTEVKTGAYKNYVKAAGIKMPPEPMIGQKSFNEGWASDSQPMSMASWADAHSYCQWAGMRLPTEAEWEYAARGPSGSISQDLNAVAWFADNSGQARINSQVVRQQAPNDWIRKLLENGNGPHEVAQKAANGWKLSDMLGNVWEWTSDWYRDNTYAASAADDPTGPDSGFHHVLRGGSWLNPPGYIRPARRLKGIPDQRIFTNGFRCAGLTIK